MQNAQQIIVMGVSGCGKTTLGKALGEELHYDFIDADDFHSLQNIEKMSRGEGLTDDDRANWLESLNDNLQQRKTEGLSTVLACSALKESYREVLGSGIDEIIFIWIEISFGEAELRLAKRKGHFVKGDLLESQFEDLEMPHSAIRITAEWSLDKAIAHAVLALSFAD